MKKKLKILLFCALCAVIIMQTAFIVRFHVLEAPVPEWATTETEVILYDYFYRNPTAVRKALESMSYDEIALSKTFCFLIGLKNSNRHIVFIHTLFKGDAERFYKALEKAGISFGEQ